MKAFAFHRLHTLRMENTAAGYALAELKPRFDRLAGRHENGTAPKAIAVHQLFQTPVGIAQKLALLLELPTGSRILEPSAGLGRLLNALDTYSPSEVVAVELAPECAGELYRQDRDRTVIKQGDFLAVTPDKLGLFDAVIMNPPFTMRSDIKHTLHALKFLKPGGKLAGLCMSGPHRDQELKPLASQWIDLEPRSFAEAGTNINAHMFLIEL